jgi:hypothetical protein
MVWTEYAEIAFSEGFKKIKGEENLAVRMTR